MLRIRFYNRRFASRAPATKTSSSETSRRAPWVTPPAFAFEILLEHGVAACSRRTPDHLAVIRPPTAPCLTARCRLRVERRPRRAFALHGESGAAFFGCRHASPVEPSDTSWTNERGARERPGSLRWTRFHGQHVNAARFREPEVPSAGEVLNKHPRGHLLRSPAPVGRRAQALHVFIDVRKLRLDPSPHRSRGRFMAACASTTSAERYFNEHDSGPPEHPGPAESVAGTAAGSIDRRLSIEDSRRRYAGSGAEDHRASTFPLGIAPERDFAPTPIASDTSCRGHCPSPCPESTRETDEAASAVHASKACAAGGPCDARFPRRNPTFTNPRGLPSQGRSRTGRLLDRREPVRSVAQRLFHCGETARGTLARGPAARPFDKGER